jgi:hypothetical protein
MAGKTMLAQNRKNFVLEILNERRIEKLDGTQVRILCRCSLDAWSGTVDQQGQKE